jgi:Fe-S oxidoreductase
MLATGNVGCMIQLRAGVDQRNMNFPVKHVMELLGKPFPKLPVKEELF